MAVVPVRTVVHAQHLLGIRGEPQSHMLPVPIMSPHLTNVYPVKQLQAYCDFKALQQ